MTLVPVAADGVTDDSAMINAVLADPATSVAELPAGVVGLGAAVVLPSGKMLVGAGRELTRLLALPSFVHNVVVASSIGARGVGVSDLTIDGNKVGRDGGLTARVNGLQMTLARRFWVRRVDVRNCTGYGHYVTGDANDFSEMASDGAWEDCRAANCEIHFEQMFSEHITLINCHSRDGEGDLNCHSWFHPVVGSRNILYLGCSGRGRAGAGIEATANVRDLERIRFVACDIHVTTGTTALVTSAGVGRTDGLELIATRIRSELGIGAQLHNTEASAVQCSISGHGEALQVRNGSLLTATSTDVLGVADADAGNTAIGVNLDATSHVRWIGGSIEALGQARQRVPIYGAVANAEISDSTRIVPGRLRVYKVQEIYGLASIQQDGATTAFANIVVPAPVSNVDRAHLDFSIRKSADRYTADKIGASWSWMNNQTIRVRLAGDGTLPATAKLAYHFVEWGERP